jgi:uncharacterized protein YegL
MKTLVLTVTAIAFGMITYGQRGYGISSSAYLYHHGGNGQRVIQSNYVVEEEIFNYHTHKIEEANYNEPVKISHAWGNENFTTNTDEVILQLGIATHRASKLDNIPPANISLVVDVSGSMGGAPIQKSKESMREFVKQLRPDDHVSLVLFGSQVFIPYKSQKIGDRKALLKAIDEIKIQGSTNVHLGMQEGYKQVASTYSKSGNNRVIVFTDAMANTGVIDPNQILANTKVYVKDIDLTFIGIGMRFNQDFARQIKTRLRGHMHFVQDSREITKLFKEEVEQFLASPYGKKVKLVIELPEQLALEKFYGYDPTISGNRVELEVDDMQGGLTQIFMLKLKRKKGRSGKIEAVKYGLSFINQSDFNETLVGQTAEIKVTKSNEAYEKLANSEVKKNYCIAYMANQLKQATLKYEKDSDAEQFYNTIDQVMASVDLEYKTLDDDLQYVYDLMSKQTDPNRKSKQQIVLSENL